MCGTAQNMPDPGADNCFAMRNPGERRSEHRKRPVQCAGGMKPSADRLRPLTGCRDIASLISAVRELCTEFGKVTHIDVLTTAKAEKRRALLFLRLESAAQEQRLISALGVCRFGGEVLVIVDFPSDTGSVFL